MSKNTLDVQNDENLDYIQAILLRRPVSDEHIDLMKQANLEEEYSDLIDEAFADRENRMFPINTKENTLISAMYISDQSSDVPDIVKQACAEALEEWGVELKIEETLEKEASSAKVTDFLLPSIKKLPVVDKDTLLKSAGILSSQFGTLGMIEKVEGASQMVKYAMAYGVSPADIDDKFDTYGFNRSCNLSKLSMAVSDRLGILGDELREEYGAFLRKLAQEKELNNGDTIIFDKSKNMGIVYELIELDKRASLFGTFDPIVDVFNGEVLTDFKKEASDNSSEFIDEEVEIGGYMIPLSKIASVSEEHMALYIGDAASDSVSSGGALDLDKLAVFIEDLTLSAQNEIAAAIMNG